VKESKKESKKSLKTKKTISQKITRINTSSSISYGDAELNSKDKRVKWVFGAGIISLLAIGIGVPVGLAGVQYVAQKAYNSSDRVFDDETIENLEGILDKDQNVNNAALKNIENILIELLYTEEREAFFKFEAFVNETKYKETGEKVGPTSFGFDVSKSSKDISNEQQKKLDNSKKAMRESDPIGWPKKWDNELKTNELYGNANNETEALDFMVATIKKEAAFARFNTAEITIDQWKLADLELQAKNTITYKIDDTSHTIAVGTKLFSKSLIGISKTFLPFLKKGETNIGLSNTTGSQTPSNEVKISVYQSKSYVLEKRNPLNIWSDLEDYYSPSANISSLFLPIIRNDDTVANFWTISRDLLFNLFKIVTPPSGISFTSIGKISSFEGANTNTLNNNTPQREIDELIINTITTVTEEPTTKTPATTGSMLGSSKVSSLATFIKSEENDFRSFNVAAISSIL